MRSWHTLAAVVLALVCVGPARAQCDWDLSPQFALPGNGGAPAVMQLFNPDGAGPLPLSLVVGGYFTHAGLEPASGLAIYDGTAWSSPGSGVDGEVRALTVYNGRLIAGGGFSAAGGQPAANIAAWDGSAWEPLGGGVNDQVTALAVYGGELYAAGFFTSAGGLPVGRIARWNGSAWNAVGTGIVGLPSCMASYGGSLYVGGSFSSAGGVALTNLARWTGSAWQAAGNPNAAVQAMGVRTTISALTSHLFIAGSFTQVGGIAANRIALYNAVATPQWVALGGGLPAACLGLSVRGVGLNGYELAASTGSSGVTSCRVYRWSGGVWTPLGSAGAVGGGPVSLFGGQYVAAASCDPGTRGVHAWDGANWAPLGDGINGSVHALLAEGQDLYIAGEYDRALRTPAANIGRLDSGAFSPLGGGTDGTVRGLARFGGDLFAGGSFNMAGGLFSFGVARWNGLAWAPAGLPDPVFFPATEGVYAFAVYDGALIAGGVLETLNVAWKWNGTTWAPFDVGLDPFATIYTLAVHNGVLYAGGTKDLAVGSTSPLARYNAAAGAWSAVSTPGWSSNFWYVRAMQSFEGVLYVGGQSLGLSAAGVHPLGKLVGGDLLRVEEVYEAGGTDQRIRSMGVYQGRLHVSGDFNTVDGQFATGLAVFDGNIWTPTGPVGITSPVARFETMAVHEDKLYIGGSPTKAGYHFVQGWSRLSCTSACYANCDQSTIAPILNVADFTCFLQKFAAAEPSANCDGSTTAPALNVADFTCFLQRFAAGCP